MDELLQTILSKLGMQVPKAPQQLDPTTQALLDQRAKADQAAMPAGPTSLVRHGIDSASQFVRGLGYNPTDPVPADADASYKAGGLAAAAMPLFGAKGIPGLYSRVERVAEGLPEAGVNAGKLASLLKQNASKAETEWRGLDSMMTNRGQQPIPKAEVVQHLQQHPFDVSVTRKGGSPVKVVQNNNGWAVTDGTGYEPYQTRSADDALNHASDINSSRATVHDIYQMPGHLPGSYREDLIKLSSKPLAKPTGPAVPDGAGGLATPTEGIDFTHPHWPDESNVLVHVRHNERNLPGILDPAVLDKLVNAQDDAYQVGRESFNSDSLDAFHKARDARNAYIQAPGPKGRMLENVQSDWQQRGEHGGFGEQPRTDTQTTLYNRELAAYHDLEQANRLYLQAYENRRARVTRGPQLPPFQSDPNWGADRLGYELTEHMRPLLGEMEGQPGFADLHEAYIRHRGARVAYDNAMDASQRAAGHSVPDMPYKGLSDPPTLALKQQLLDIAHNRPDLKWLGIAPSSELNARGEGIDPSFQDQMLPKILEKLLKPFGGSVERNVDLGTKSEHAPQPRWSGAAGPFGGLVERSGNSENEIYNLLPTRLDAQATIDQARRAIEAQRPNIHSPGIAHLTPEMLAQIKEKGFSMLAALLAARMMPSHQQPSHGQ